MNFINYFANNATQILTLLLEHINLSLISVVLSIVIGVPLGILISYVERANKPILAFANIMQAIPSMALLGFMIPFFGIGSTPAIIAVVLYCLLPIIKNTYTGIINISPDVIEAAKGIGLTKFQILYRIQIPLALPVIMAGVRMAAVNAVGLMTMAAFIGAGGLGFLVFSGIRTVNNAQILAGAVPACLLALSVDYIVGIVEDMVVPAGLKVSANTNISIKSTKNKMFFKKGILATTALLIVISFGINMFNPAITGDREINIGAKDYTEQALLGHLVSHMIEGNSDIKVNKTFDLSGTKIIFGALLKKDIDMYVEYCGSAYSDTLQYKPIGDVEKVMNTVKNEFKEKYKIDVLGPIGEDKFNNSYVLAVTHDTANKYNLKTVSDFAKVAHLLKSGTTYEFLNREDGLPGMQKTYGFKMKSSVALDSSPRYVALLNGEVDVIDAFETDGLLKKFDLVSLQDDLKFFPPYHAVPIINEEILQKYPEIPTILEKLNPYISNQSMTELNYKVDELGEKPEEVAKQFLISKGLIK